MLLSIPLPIFDRNQGTILEARYQLAKAGEDRRTAEVRVLTDLAATYAELSSAFTEATTLNNEVLPGAQGAFEAFSEGYRQGKFGFLDVLDAQRTLFEARGQYLEALATYHRAVAEMERLIGEPLAAVNSSQERRNRRPRMRGKQTIMIIITAVVGIMAGATLMWSVGRMNGAATNAREDAQPRRDV